MILEGNMYRELSRHQLLPVSSLYPGDQREFNVLHQPVAVFLLTSFKR